MKVKSLRGHVRAVEQQSSKKAAQCDASLQAQPSAEHGAGRDPSVDAQAAHADGDRRPGDGKATLRVLMTESGKETANGQRVRRVACCQPRRAEREQYQAERRAGRQSSVDP